MTPEPARLASPPRKRFSPRGAAEAAATIVIEAGVVMLMQPFSLALYGWSFTVTLVGTVMFIAGSMLPE